MNQYPQLVPYVEAAADSSKRARWVLLILVTSSILVLAAYLNSRPENWMDSRIKVAQHAVSLWDSTTHAFKSDGSAAATFVQKYGIGSIEELRVWLNGYIVSKQQNVQQIRVPFFAFAFDVNDLGLISGATFVLLLLLLRFWMLREIRNYETVFEKVSKNPGELNVVYDVLSMRQVLTVPPSKPQWTEFLWSIPIKLLFLLPFVLQYVVYRNDSATADIGRMFSQSNVNLIETVHIVSLIFITILTLSCLYISIKFDVLWYQTKSRIQRNQQIVPPSTPQVTPQQDPDR